MHTAYASYTLKGNGIISSAVAVGLPNNLDCIGVIMEYSHIGNQSSCVEIVENLALQAMKQRCIGVKDVISIGIEAPLSDDKFVTTFAGLILW